MGSDGCDSKGCGWIPPSSGLAYHRDVSLASQRGGMGVIIGGRGLGGREDVSNEGVNLEVAGYHYEIYRESPYL